MATEWVSDHPPWLSETMKCHLKALPQNPCSFFLTFVLVLILRRMDAVYHDRSMEATRTPQGWSSPSIILFFFLNAKSLVLCCVYQTSCTISFQIPFLPDILP